MSESREHVHLTVTLPSGAVMIPSWLGLLFVLSFLLATFALLLVWQSEQNQIESSKQEMREIRSLQLHTEDVENVLIRNGLAKREDFILWLKKEK